MRFLEGSSRSLVFCAAVVIAVASVMAGRVAWETRDTGGAKEAEISVARAAQVEDGGGNDQDADQRIQQLLDRYGNVECTDFESRQQAQDVFELDQILFGDALDSNINGTACDEEDFFSGQNKTAGRASWRPEDPGTAPYRSCPAAIARWSSHSRRAKPATLPNSS